MTARVALRFLRHIARPACTSPPSSLRLWLAGWSKIIAITNRFPTRFFDVSKSECETVRREESTNRRKGPILQFLEIPGKIQKPDHLNPKSTFMGERGLGGEGRGSRSVCIIHSFCSNGKRDKTQAFEQRTRNSAIADKPRDAFRGQSRSPNMVPFHMIPK